VIPAPDKLTFDISNISAAACCIPATLLLVFIGGNTLKLDWRRRCSHVNDTQEMGKVVEGSNSALVEEMKRVKIVIGMCFNAIEIPVSCAAVIIIALCGERNFFTPQVKYRTEPIISGTVSEEGQ
jgi:hypothetical protein